MSGARHFAVPTGEGFDSPSELLVSSARLESVGGHDRVQLWSRGALVGELVFGFGDGEDFITDVLMLAERSDG